MSLLYPLSFLLNIPRLQFKKRGLKDISCGIVLFSGSSDPFLMELDYSVLTFNEVKMERLVLTPKIKINV